MRRWRFAKCYIIARCDEHRAVVRRRAQQRAIGWRQHHVKRGKPLADRTACVGQVGTGTVRSADHPRKRRKLSLMKLGGKLRRDMSRQQIRIKHGAEQRERCQDPAVSTRYFSRHGARAYSPLQRRSRAIRPHCEATTRRTDRIASMHADALAAPARSLRTPSGQRADRYAGRTNISASRRGVRSKGVGDAETVPAIVS